VSAQVEVDLGAHVESVLFVVMCLLLIWFVWHLKHVRRVDLALCFVDGTSSPQSATTQNTVYSYVHRLSQPISFTSSQ
jgi:hypothetical protein